MAFKETDMCVEVYMCLYFPPNTQKALPDSKKPAP